MYDTYSLETPESVVVGLPIAGVGTRFLATLIDTAIIACILLAFFVIIAIGSGLGSTAGYVVAAVGYVGLAVTFLGYYIFFEIIWNGQTPGKRSQRARVIRANGYPVTPFAVVIRNVLRLVDLLPGLYTVGLICMIVDRRSRRLGDLMAGTIVVKEGREGSLAALTSSSLPLTLTPRSTAAPTGATHLYAPGDNSSTATAAARPAASVALTREDEALIRDFLVRRYQLDGRRREQLAVRIAASVHGRLGGAAPAPFQTERYLEEVLAAGGALAPSAASSGSHDTGWDAFSLTGRLTPEDAGLIRDFLDRRYSLDGEHRARLAERLSALVYSHLGGEPPDTPESYLERALKGYVSR